MHVRILHLVSCMRLRWSRGSVLAFSTQVRGFKPGRIRRIFRAKKILSTPSFGGEVKPSVPCCRFSACKRAQNLRGSRNLGKITGNFPSGVFPCGFPTKILRVFLLLLTGLNFLGSVIVKLLTCRFVRRENVFWNDAWWQVLAESGTSVNVILCSP